MAKLEKILKVDFETAVEKIYNGILEGSITASLEDNTEFAENGARCTVMVFERFAYIGGNRLSMTVTIFQAGDGPVRLSAITAGGSQAMFVKINTIGEENFLAKLQQLLLEEKMI